MGKLLVSIYAGKAEHVINSKKPSALIPFKGEFPLLPNWRRLDWNQIVDNNMYVEDCPQWAQDIMIKGEQMYELDKSFKKFLHKNNITIDSFKKKSNSDKATELIRFFNAESISMNVLQVG